MSCEMVLHMSMNDPPSGMSVDTAFEDSDCSNAGKCLFKGA